MTTFTTFADNRIIISCSIIRASIEAILAMCWGKQIVWVVASNSLLIHASILLIIGYVQAANDSDLEPVAYEFFTQAFILYEEEISVSNLGCNFN